MSAPLPILSYRYPDDTPVPGRIVPLALCLPPLAWLAVTLNILLGSNRETMGWYPLVTVTALGLGFRAWRWYRHAPRTWYVVVCLSLNGLVLLLSATPLALLWGWGLLTVMTR